MLVKGTPGLTELTLVWLLYNGRMSPAGYNIEKSQDNNGTQWSPRRDTMGWNDSARGGFYLAGEKMADILQMTFLTH